MKLKLRKFGNSYGVIIPRKFLTDKDFNAEEIDIEIRGAEFIEKIVEDVRKRKTATEVMIEVTHPVAMPKEEPVTTVATTEMEVVDNQLTTEPIEDNLPSEEVVAALDGELTYGSGKKDDAKKRDPFRKLNKTKRKPISSRFEFCPKHKGSYKMTCGCK